MSRQRSLAIVAYRALLTGGLFLILAVSAFAQTFQAKVVGVSDGDTITVFDGTEQTRIRLEGIDCPEDGADFSRRAKQFTSDLVFGNTVHIVGKERDPYGRLVARVHVGNTDVSLALVEGGLAWHYTDYSNDPVLAKAERQARTRKVGVWSLSNPTPPWQHRSRGSAARAGVVGEHSDANAGAVSSTTVYHGNSKSRVYHAPGCQHYDCKNCTVILNTKQEATSRGFRPHSGRGGCVR